MPTDLPENELSEQEQDTQTSSQVGESLSTDPIPVSSQINTTEPQTDETPSVPEIQESLLSVTEIDTSIPQEQETTSFNAMQWMRRVQQLESINGREPTMDEIENLIAEAFSGADNSDFTPEGRLLSFNYGLSNLKNIYEATIRKGIGNINTSQDGSNYRETLLTRSNMYKALWAAASCKANESVPFAQLSVSEKDNYISSLAIISHMYSSGYHEGSYWFGNSYARPTEGKLLLEQISQNKEKLLSPEEELKVYESEQNIFKIHLNVPPERKIEVLKAILEAKKKDSEIIESLFEIKKKEGNPEARVTIEEAIAAGCQAPYLGVFKMRDTEENLNNISDFIFYAPDDPNRSIKALVQMAQELSHILAPLQLPQTENIPRYSTPIVINGEFIPGMSFTQGNGDFKDYLRRVNPTTLDKFYDRTHNWALRPNSTLSFDK